MTLLSLLIPTRQRTIKTFRSNYFRTRISIIIFVSSFLLLSSMAVVSITFVYNRNEQNMFDMMKSRVSTIQNMFEIKGLSISDERKAEAIYLTCLVGREDEENFYNDLADCFLYADAENDVFDWITAMFGVEISEDDREMIEKIE